MTKTGWQQNTVWLVGNRLPMGDTHDGQGRRPLLHGAFGPQGQTGLLISDEQQNVYFAAVQGSRIMQRQWLKLAQDEHAPGQHHQLGQNHSSLQPIGGGGSMSVGSYRFAALYYPEAGFDDVTLEGTTITGAAVNSASIQTHLIQSHFDPDCSAPGRVVLHARSASAASLTYQAKPRLLLNRRGVPEVIHWRRNAQSDLLLAMEDGSVRRWQGLEDPSLSPLPGDGEPVLAGDRPMAFDGMVHLSVVDWNLRGAGDLLIATEQGELWLFYDVGPKGPDGHVAYDQGRRLCDAQGPIQLFGSASATLLRQDNDRWLVAADGQGQLWHWKLEPVTSWVVSDWKVAAHVATSNRTAASSYEPGHWWVQREQRQEHGPQSDAILRIGPPVVDQVITGGQPLPFAPLPPELTLPSPCDGPCEIHITLASLEPVLKHIAMNDEDAHCEHPLCLDSMIDLRVGGQIHPQLVSAERLAQGCTREIYWGTADLTDNAICLSGLHGGFLFEGGLPAAVVSVRLVPLTPQKHSAITQPQHSGQRSEHNQSQNESQKTGPGGVVLEETPAAVLENVRGSDSAGRALANRDMSDTDDELADDEIETLDTSIDDPPPQRVPLAGLLETFGWTSMMRADSVQEVDELVARHQAAGIERLYWRVGGGPWEYPSHVPGGQNTIPQNCSLAHEALAQRQADLFEHVNRLEMASASTTSREMELFAWLRLHHQSEHQPPHKFESVDQFSLDHPQYLEKDVHGQPMAGKMCLGYQPVREFYVRMVLEMMHMGIHGLLIDMVDHLPRVSYGDPIVTEFKEIYRCDMRHLSPFDLRVVEFQALVMTRFLRQLRDAVHHARPRVRLKIHARVAGPRVMMGCDPAAWAREHLVDAILLDTSAVTHEQRLISMAHIVEGTNCQIAGVLDAQSNDCQSVVANRIATRVRNLVSVGASFVVFDDTAKLIRQRGVCQAMRRINTPDEHQPRAVLA